MREHILMRENILTNADSDAEFERAVRGTHSDERLYSNERTHFRDRTHSNQCYGDAGLKTVVRGGLLVRCVYESRWKQRSHL
jgi:hypothetical protein